MNKILAGAASGFAATAPMTAAMLVMHRMLPAHQRYALPPRKVTMNVARTLSIKHKMDREEKDAATIAAHFGYGTAMGGIYSTFADQVPAPRVATGIGWGLIVWAASYLGLLPGLELHESAKDHPAERNILMILAHVVWGATLGIMMEGRERGWMNKWGGRLRHFQ